jgi:hypothetical protein
MKKKLLFFGMVFIALLLTSGTFAYTYTNSNTILPMLASGEFATYEVSTNQPDWNIVMPQAMSEILVPNDCGDVTQLPSQYPCCGSHWEKVDDQPYPDDLNTYVSTEGSSAWKKDLYELSNYTIANGDETISSLIIYYRFATDRSGYTAYAQPIIYTNDEICEGTVTTTDDTNFTTVSWELDTNPITEGAWTWDEINDLQAGIEMKGYSSNKAAICTQVYVQVNFEGSFSSGELPQGYLFVVTPDSTYTGDLMVKVYITNTADLLKAYKYINIKIFVANSIEAGESPNYQILSLENGVIMFNIIGGSASSYTVRVLGGSYSLVSNNPEEWGTGWTIIPEFYCEVTQR